MRINENDFCYEKWKTLSYLNKKRLIEKEVRYLCLLNNIEKPQIKYKNLGYKDAIFNAEINEIIFNLNMINETGAYEYISDIGIHILSVVYHEIEHVKQSQFLIFNPTSLGLIQPIVELNIENNEDTINKNLKASLYIRNNFNKYMQNVYVLQPNEYEAFTKSVEVLEMYHSNNERINVIKDAISFIKDTFKIENPVQEISNSLMNLYDGGNRYCSSQIFDLVKRCAICSYSEVQDYGVDRTTLFLGKNYEEMIKKYNKENEKYLEFL